MSVEVAPRAVTSICGSTPVSISLHSYRPSLTLRVRNNREFEIPDVDALEVERIFTRFTNFRNLYVCAHSQFITNVVSALSSEKKRCKPDRCQSILSVLSTYNDQSVLHQSYCKLFSSFEFSLTKLRLVVFYMNNIENKDQFASIWGEPLSKLKKLRNLELDYRCVIYDDPARSGLINFAEICKEIQSLRHLSVRHAADPPLLFSLFSMQKYFSLIGKLRSFNIGSLICKDLNRFKSSQYVNDHERSAKMCSFGSDDSDRIFRIDCRSDFLFFDASNSKKQHCSNSV